MNAYVQTLPSNIEAEQAILGAMLVRNDAMSTIPAEFSQEHFSERAHLEIFAAIKAGVAAGRSVNPITVRSFISPNFANEKVGDMTMASYIARLASEAVGTSLKGLCEAVIDAFHRRQAITAAEEAHIAAYSARDELEFVDRISDARARLNDILASISRRNEPEETMWDMVDATLNQTGMALSGHGAMGLDPGIPEMSQLTGPWGEGKLIVIGGDVKTGKSSAAWQCTFNIAEKHPIGGYSGEMPVEQIIMREKARRTGISAKRQRLGQVSDIEIDELVRAGADMKRLKPFNITSKPLTLEDIDERINRLQGDLGIKAFVVDHILKLNWTGKMEDADDFKKANRATSTLKNIAMKRNIALVALTHINKGSNFEPYGKTFNEKLNSAIRRRPTYKSMLGNVDKDVDDMIIVHQAYPAVAALEPEPETGDYDVWEAAMERVKGKAEFILALSRENEFPRRKEIQWNGSSTSFGPEFRSVPTRDLF